MSARRLVWIGAALFVLLAAVGGWALQTYTTRALEYAETFRHRRMLVAKQGEDDVYRFFYATNRRPGAASGPVEERFTSDRHEEIEYGFFETAIEPSLGIGVLIDPSDWMQNEEIKLRRIEPLDRDAFVEALRSSVQATASGALLVNVNGFRERFPSALRKTAFLGHVLDLNAPILVFDWPGDQGSSPMGYRSAQGIARESATELASLLDLIEREVRPDRLWLLANSMGGEVAIGALLSLYQSGDWSDPEPEFDHVVLTAPDVSHADFGKRAEEELAATARHFTVYVSSNDRALLMSRVLNRERRLGESTVDPSNPDQYDEAARALELVEPAGDRVTLVDVTPVNRTRNFHNFGLETPEFIDDLFLRLSSPTMPPTRLLYPVRTSQGTRYWVLTRGR